MTTTIKTHIVRIGDSQGVRIPKLLLEQVDLGEEVVLEVQDRQLIIRAARTNRQGWAEQFQRMAERRDDALLDDDLIESVWDNEEWEW